MKKGFISIVSAITGLAIGAGVIGKAAYKSTSKLQSLSDKHLDLFLLMNHWVKIKQEGNNLSLYLKERGYQKIAVYGMSYAGERLVDELKDSDIVIAYGIDKNAESIYSEVDVITPDEIQDDVDAVIVTSIAFFDEIESMLLEKVTCPIVSLEDILFTM